MIWWQPDLSLFCAALQLKWHLCSTTAAHLWLNPEACTREMSWRCFSSYFSSKILREKRLGAALILSCGSTENWLIQVEHAELEPQECQKHLACENQNICWLFSFIPGTQRRHLSVKTLSFTHLMNVFQIVVVDKYTLFCISSPELLRKESWSSSAWEVQFVSSFWIRLKPETR